MKRDWCDIWEVEADEDEDECGMEEEEEEEDRTDLEDKFDASLWAAWEGRTVMTSM